LYNEKFIYSKVIDVKYDLEVKGIRKTGTAILVDADLTKAVLFDKGFITVAADQRINKLVPERTLKTIVFHEQFFTNISFDSLNNLLKNKPVLSLKLQSVLPINFVNDNKPQSSITIDLTYLFNPIFQSTNIDSVDRIIETQIALAEEEKSNVEAKIIYEKAENINNSLGKEEAIKSYNQLLNDINSDDLATKEKATKELPAAKNKMEQFTKLETIK